MKQSKSGAFEVRVCSRWGASLVLSIDFVSLMIFNRLWNHPLVEGVVWGEGERAIGTIWLPCFCSERRWWQQVNELSRSFSAKQLKCLWEGTLLTPAISSPLPHTQKRQTHFPYCPRKQLCTSLLCKIHLGGSLMPAGEITVSFCCDGWGEREAGGVGVTWQTLQMEKLQLLLKKRRKKGC